MSFLNVDPNKAREDARRKAKAALELATFEVPIQGCGAAHAECQADDEAEHRDEDLIGADCALQSA
jgi:hypothetical protein